MRFFLSFFFFLSACSSTLTPKFVGNVWLFKALPADMCTPEVYDAGGIYRKLKDGSTEHVSICDPMIGKYLASYVDDVELSEK